MKIGKILVKASLFGNGLSLGAYASLRMFGEFGKDPNTGHPVYTPKGGRPIYYGLFAKAPPVTTVIHHSSDGFKIVSNTSLEKSLPHTGYGGGRRA